MQPAHAEGRPALTETGRFALIILLLLAAPPSAFWCAPHHGQINLWVSDVRKQKGEQIHSSGTAPLYARACSRRATCQPARKASAGR